MRAIADLQDHRNTDSLLLYLRDANASYRKSAALALASVQDSTAATMLGNILLEDPDAGVRAAAAFALGQTGSFAAVNALLPDMQDVDTLVRYEVRVALGKTVTARDFATFLESGKDDMYNDRGLAWGLFHVGSRRIADSVIVKKAATLLGSDDQQTQLGAANFFSRSVYPPHSSVQPALITAARAGDADVRIAATFALRKFLNAQSLDVIGQALGADADYRVRVNAVRSLQGFEWARVATHYKTAIQDSDEPVVVATAEALRQRLSSAPGKNSDKSGGPKNFTADEIAALIPLSKSWRASAVLTEIVLTLDPTKKRIDQVDLNVQDPYQLAAKIDALGSAPLAYPLIVEKLFTSKERVVQSTAANALVKINRNPSFPLSQQKEFADIYQRAIANGDQGVILYVCGALADSTLGYRNIITNIDFLREAKAKLSLPKDFETLIPLERAIAWFEKQPAPKQPVNTFNHPIDWKVAATISSEEKMLIKTSKGDVTIRLLIDEAPGSVVNFVRLAEAGYFNEKFVHRVVPNFVIQTGCNRGDGFGSEDYSIRSEFSMRRYKTGSVGMASAGKDTEGTQWFITHSSTPHLDGKYTIFAEVIDGQAVVDQIEVGDRILSASLVKN